jgi:hypothetical protein
VLSPPELDSPWHCDALAWAEQVSACSNRAFRGSSRSVWPGVDSQPIRPLRTFRFPGRTISADVPGWAESVLNPTAVPNSPAFEDLRRSADTCGLTKLAGKAVGASFVGAVSATLAISEAVRELNGGAGTDITTISLDTFDFVHTSATSAANVVPLPLRALTEHE